MKFVPILFSFFCLHAFSQGIDTVKTLDEVIIKAYAHEKSIRDVPAAIAKITSVDLERFNNTSILPALNTQPGVRMEERSPGSYRLSIRGSTLRSPFGIRNVKIYFNGLPLTDNGGNTYLNLLDFNSIDGLEIVKGPGSSLYGAGTGGVVLINKNIYRKEKLSAGILGGSYGLLRYNLAASQSFSKASITTNYAHQQSNGYREQSAMSRDMFGLQSSIETGKNSSISLNFLYSNLYYQTPGGLTQIQYDTLPTMSRPGSAAKKAAIYNKTFFGGLTWSNDWNKNLTTNISVFGNATNFKNPAIANYEKRDEKSWGMRTENHWRNNSGKLTVGAEFQTGRSLISVGTNNQGNFVDAGNNVRLPTNIFFLFTQYDWNLPAGFFLTTGLSLNQLNLRFDTLGASGYNNVNQRKLSSIFSPRVALLKKLNSKLSAYTSYSRGYSPPTTAEVFPSLAIYNPNLKPEYGSNYEAGLKGIWELTEVGVAFYSFLLDQTIIKLDSSGSDYFTNSGRTAQNGVELYIKFKTRIGLSGWYSHAFNHYRFKDYVQGANDLSGNKLTGAPPTVLSTGIDYIRNGFYINITANFVDKIPLNDANTVFAKAYSLVGSRVGYRFEKGKVPFEIFGGADNLLDARYSLGNDLNAFGGRYFNAATGRNFYLGANLKMN